MGDDWFVAPDGDRADLARHGSLRRMFLALVESHEADPEACLDVDALFTGGWPGERIAPDSMRNRVHVNLAKLRSMGLRDVLGRTEAGYRLDPALPVRRA